MMGQPLVAFTGDFATLVAGGDAFYYALEDGIPFAPMSKTLFWQLNIITLGTSVTVTIITQFSLDGVNWVDGITLVNAAAAVGVTGGSSADALAPKSRLRMKVTGGSGHGQTTLKFVIDAKAV